MVGRFSELRKKWIVNSRKGSIVGKVTDLEIDFDTNRVTALVAGGNRRFWGLFGAQEETVIGWSQIEIIGEDAILVNLEMPLNRTV